MKIVIQIILGAAIIALGYILWISIDKPIKFQKEKDRRVGMVVERLKDIRTSQMAYKEKYGKYTGHFDTLVEYIKHDSFAVVKAIGSIPEELLDSISEQEAVEMNMITRDTVMMSIMDSLFGKRPYAVDSMCIIPNTVGQKFELGAGELQTGSKIIIQVFEAKASNNIILDGMDRQEIINLNSEQKKLERYQGVKVGSLTEATNNAGNWE